MVFSKRGCFLGSTSPAEEREFTFATCVPAGARTFKWEAVFAPHKTLPVPKSSFCSSWTSPKLLLPYFFWELCTVALWSSSKSFITSHSPRAAFCTLHSSPRPGLWSKQQGKLRNAFPWKEGVGIEGKHFFQEGQAQLRDHPSNLYSFLCCFTFPSAKKYIYIGPRFIPDVNPLTARITLGINLVHHV